MYLTQVVSSSTKEDKIMNNCHEVDNINKTLLKGSQNAKYYIGIFLNRASPKLDKRVYSIKIETFFLPNLLNVDGHLSTAYFVPVSESDVRFILVLY